MSEMIVLPDRLDISSCQSLLPDLLALRRRDIVLDAASTRHIGAVGAQFLCSAHATWQGDGAPFAIANLGETALKCLAGLGIDPETLGITATEEMPA